MPQLFYAQPTFNFYPTKIRCCSQAVKLFKTKKKKLSTLLTGDCEAHYAITYCQICKNKYSSSELPLLTPVHCRFGYDVIEYVGKAMYVEHHSDEKIQQSLTQRSISISLREVAFLARKFIVYLALCHEQASPSIKTHLSNQGGYVLHLDGSCEGASPHLITSLDSLSGFILHNVKLPSENKKNLIPFLKTIHSRYGDPIAIVHDMSNAIIAAVETVFPNSKDLICHFHFLRDLGKDLLSIYYRSIQRIIKQSKVRTHIRDAIKLLKTSINQAPEQLAELEAQLKTKQYDQSLTSEVSAYLCLTWLLEGSANVHGYGFPFDRPHLDFCVRMQQSLPLLEKLNNTLKIVPIRPIQKLLNERQLKHNINLIEEKIAVFDPLRQAMQLALPENSKGLNDEGEQNIKLIEQKVKAWRYSDAVKQLDKTNLLYHKMLKQIDTYGSPVLCVAVE